MVRTAGIACCLRLLGVASALSPTIGCATRLRLLPGVLPCLSLLVQHLAGPSCDTSAILLVCHPADVDMSLKRMLKLQGMAIKNTYYVPRRAAPAATVPAPLQPRRGVEVSG